MKCKDCKCELTLRNWPLSLQSRKYYLCRSCCNARCSKYYYMHHEIEKAKARRRVSERYRKYRQEVLILLGNKCSNPSCPIPPQKLDLRTLQIDHILNNGNEERSKFSYGSSRGYSSTGYIRYVLLKIKSGSHEYQLLCPYCNWRKRYL